MASDCPIGLDYLLLLLCPCVFGIGVCFLA